MGTLSVLVLIFVVGHQISNANPPPGTDFSIGRVFGVGESGVVREGYTGDGIKIAVKVTRCEENTDDSLIYEEFLALKAITDSLQDPLYLPKVLGQRELIVTTESEEGAPERNSYDVLAMELLGDNLENIQNNFSKDSQKDPQKDLQEDRHEDSQEDLYKHPQEDIDDDPHEDIDDDPQEDIQEDAPFGKYTTAHLAIKLISAVRGIHAAGFFHRDLKPGNIVIRREDITEIVIIDFAFAKKADPPSEYYTGDMQYMSLNNHNNGFVGKLEDLETLFYVLIKFSFGSLPWTKFAFANAANYCISLFKRTLFRTLAELPEVFPYTQPEESKFDIYKTSANQETGALKAQLTQSEHPGLLNYAQVLITIMIREKGNPNQKITDQDYANLLAGFEAEMTQFKDGDKILDWAYIKNEDNLSRGIEFKDEPTFSVEKMVSLILDENSDKAEEDDKDENYDKDEEDDKGEEDDKDENYDKDEEDDKGEEDDKDEDYDTYKENDEHEKAGKDEKKGSAKRKTLSSYGECQQNNSFDRNVKPKPNSAKHCPQMLKQWRRK